jgi:hypothetical protein
MMGRDKPPQRSLFYSGINLDQRVRDEHVLRKVVRLVDFEFVYGEVQQRYGNNGNVSVAPPVILKLMLLLVLYWADRKAFEYVTRKGSAKSAVYAPNAPNPRTVDELSNDTNAKRCWIAYVLKLKVQQQDEILGFVSISWRVHLLEQHGSD